MKGTTDLEDNSSTKNNQRRATGTLRKDIGKQLLQTVGGLKDSQIGILISTERSHCWLPIRLKMCDCEECITFDQLEPN